MPIDTKSLIMGLSILFTTASAIALPSQPLPRKDVVVGLHDVFVPAGFSSESESFVVVNGLFPNGCYQWKSADVTHIDPFIHEIKPMATVVQSVCVRVLVPFTKEVRLGQLAQGKHTLKFLDTDGNYMEKEIIIEQNSRVK